MNTVTGDMLVGTIVAECPELAETLMDAGMHCLGCPAAHGESLTDACVVHGLEPESVISKVNARLKELNA